MVCFFGKHSPDFFLCCFDLRFVPCYLDLVIYFSWSRDIDLLGLFFCLISPRIQFCPLCLFSFKLWCLTSKSENFSHAMVEMVYILLSPRCIFKTSQGILAVNIIIELAFYLAHIASNPLSWHEARSTRLTILIESFNLPVLVFIIEYAWNFLTAPYVVRISGINFIRPPSIYLINHRFRVSLLIKNSFLLFWCTSLVYAYIFPIHQIIWHCPVFL